MAARASQVALILCVKASYLGTQHSILRLAKLKKHYFVFIEPERQLERGGGGLRSGPNSTDGRCSSS
jgi:hypothetical protein